MTTSTNLAMRYSSRHLTKAQPYPSESINHLYGSQCRSYASNVREITQEDGSLVTGKKGHVHSNSSRDDLRVEYIFRNPSVTRHIRSSPVTSGDDDQQSPPSKFAQIKAKFEQNSRVLTMASPPSSSRRSSQTTRRDAYQRSPIEQINVVPPRPLSVSTSDRSQSSLSGGSATGSSRYLDSVDETDEELQYFHRQGNHLDRSLITLLFVSYR
jgi:hypothetical protein